MISIFPTPPSYPQRSALVAMILRRLIKSSRKTNTKKKQPTLPLLISDSSPPTWKSHRSSEFLENLYTCKCLSPALPIKLHGAGHPTSGLKAMIQLTSFPFAPFAPDPLQLNCTYHHHTMKGKEQCNAAPLRLPRTPVSRPQVWNTYIYFHGPSNPINIIAHQTNTPDVIEFNNDPESWLRS